MNALICCNPIDEPIVRRHLAARSLAGRVVVMPTDRQPQGVLMLADDDRIAFARFDPRTGRVLEVDPS